MALCCAVLSLEGEARQRRRSFAKELARTLVRSRSTEPCSPALKSIATSARRRRPSRLKTRRRADTRLGDTSARLVEGGADRFSRARYATFFQPMETELYSPDVEFVEARPRSRASTLTPRTTPAARRTTPPGARHGFRDCDLRMHRVTEPPPTSSRRAGRCSRFQLASTLGEFTGVSKYTLSGKAKGGGARTTAAARLSDGEYAARGKLAGLADMLRQFAPPNPDAPAASTAPLLRRGPSTRCAASTARPSRRSATEAPTKARLRRLLARDGLRPAERRVASGIELEEHVW